MSGRRNPSGPLKTGDRVKFDTQLARIFPGLVSRYQNTPALSRDNGVVWDPHWGRQTPNDFAALYTTVPVSQIAPEERVVVVVVV